MGSGDIIRSSPKADMPARNVEFLDESKATESGPIYGVYKKQGWKSWNNDEQENVADNLVIGRRYLPEDNVCKLRNILVTVLAT
jgi:hypothetical protein